MIHRLNCGQDLVGLPIGLQAIFHIGVGAKQGAVNLELEVERYHGKVETGADFVLTQPVFDLKLLESFFELTREIRLPTMVGILPLLSHRNAEFLHNEVPGMQIPQAVRHSMARAGDADESRREGIAIAGEALDGIRSMDRVSGVYIMPPFGRYNPALEVLEAL
jgi:homocysteine S-methyltransferase